MAVNKNENIQQVGQSASSAEHVAQKRKSLWWHKLLKVSAWVIGVLAALVLVILCAIAWILTPERLTPLVEKYGSEYLKADVKVERVELTVWKSFPFVELDVKNLSLRSRTLDGQPDSIRKALPADADKLLELNSLHAGINPWRLMGGTVKLSDIDVKGLGANIIQYGDSINNYDIFPPSEPKKEDKSKPFTIRLANVSVVADKGLRYFDGANGTDVTLINPVITLKPDKDNYALDFRSSLSLALSGHQYLSQLPVSLKGNLQWIQEPMSFCTNDLNISVSSISLNIKAAADFHDKPVLKKLQVSMPPVELMPLMDLVPEDMKKDMAFLRQLKTDLSLGLDLNVHTPWMLDSKELPNVDVNFRFPKSWLTYTDLGGGVPTKIDMMELAGTFTYKGQAPQSSFGDIKLFSVEGEGIDLNFTAAIESALSADPLIRLTSKGKADLSRLKALIPMTGLSLKGLVNADASLRCHLSDLADMRWQNLDADGSVEVRNLLVALPLMATKVYAGLSTLTFGSNMSARDAAGKLVTGMLRAQVDIDSLYCEVPGIKVGAGNIAVSAGTTPQMLAENHPGTVMPLGMQLKARRIEADSPTDTMHVLAKDLVAKGRVTRYQGNEQSPLLQAALDASKVRYTDPLTRLSVKNFNSDVSAHLRKRDVNDKTPYQRRYDAIAKANPTLSADSVAKLASSHRKRLPDNATLDLSVDNGLKALIRQWGVEGSVNADRVSLTYILYPVKTRLTHLALDFTLDSLRLHRAYISSQNNRLWVSGFIANMRQTMLGRTRRPLVVRFNTNIDTLDLNQIAYNYDLGRGLMAKRGVLAKISPEDEDALVKAAASLPVKQDEPIDTTPIIIPRNVDAQLMLRAKHAQYTDLALHNLQGRLIVNDGALSIDSLTTGTDFGNAYLNLLYSSRDLQDLNLALDVGFNRVELSNLYSTFPQIPDMMPIITNLNGIVGAQLTGSMNLFPNMDIDISSINAMLNITGADLSLTQDPMIKKIARMMLIRKNGPLDISDMNIQVALHDNVMRLYPFAFSMEKYKFALLGENDLDKNMYYHLSVLKSPIPWRFGINIKGTFDKPKFRFGGSKYKENQAREVVNLVQTERVNFVKEMRLQLHKLVNRAALDYASRIEPNEDAELKDQSMQDTPFTDPTMMITNAVGDPFAKLLGKNVSILKQMQQDIIDKKNKKK